jgi:transposase
VEERRTLVDDKTGHHNRLTACLKLYFPQLLQWFGDVSSPLVSALLERWPNLEALQRSHPGTLRKFFHQQNCRGEEKIEARIAAIYQAIPATQDDAVREGAAAITRGLIAILATLRKHIAELEQRIDELVAAHPEAPLFDSLPGAGKALVPRLIVAFGTRRERFADAEEMQRYSGIAPVKIASGKTLHVHFRRACPKFLRQTFHEFAGHSIATSVWAKAYYQHLRNDEKKDHHAAVRSLAYKWIRIIYRCWKDSKPYDEQIYLQSLRRNGSLLGALASVATPERWKPVAGFQKLS